MPRVTARLPPRDEQILHTPSPTPPPHPPQTTGGILLPDQGKKMNEGEVIAVGPGHTNRDGKLIPVNVKVGDRVLLPEYGGSAVKLGGAQRVGEEDEFTLYRDEDILGKLQ